MLWWSLRQLKADDWQARETAARKLADFNDPRSIEPLIIALQDTNARVRHAAEGALAKIGTPAIRALVGALKDRNSEVRHSAQAALIRIGNPAVLSLGLALYDGDLDAREAAATALGKIGDETSVEQLVAALKYGDSGGKEAAAAGLVRIGKPAVKPLVAALKENKLRVRETAAAALARIGRPAIEPLVAALKDSDVREAATEALWRIDSNWAKSEAAKAVVPEFVAALKHSEERSRKTAATVLGEIGDAAALEALAEALSDQSESVQEAAAASLGAIGDPRAIGPLVTAFATENAKGRKAAVAALIRIGNATIEPLVDALKDKETGVREAAASVLVRVGNVVIEPLVDALWKIDPDWAKSDAARAAVPQFVAVLKDGGKHLLRDSGEAIKKLGETRVVKPLITALKGHATTQSRPAISNVTIQDSGEVTALAQALQSSDPKVRASAAASLRQIASSLGEPLVAALQNKNKMIRRSAAHALAEMGDLRGREILRSDLHDVSKLVVLDAAESLTKLGDSAATEPLIKLLKAAGESSRNDSSHATKRAYRLLLRLLEHHAKELTVEECRSILDLHHKSELAFVASADSKRGSPNSFAGGDFIGKQELPERIDYAQARELARQELSRRNVKS
jgi:HEAT repeat protein